MLTALTLVVGARSAGAQDFSLQLKNGLVTLTARDASVPQILDRWAQIGGTTIVNRENLKSAVVTLQLNEVPEGTALAILLRDVGGYILAERVDAGRGASVIDRILILPTSSSVPVRAAAPPAIVGTQDFGSPAEPLIFREPDVQVFREPDVQEPEAPGSAPTGASPVRTRVPQTGSPALGFTPPASPQANPGAAVGSQVEAGGVGIQSPGSSLVPRANPFGATTASVRPGEVTSHVEPPGLPPPGTQTPPLETPER
jgi:hypothetical protein